MVIGDVPYWAKDDPRPNELSNNQEFKADGGKLQPRLLMEGMPRALMLVVATMTYGAQKYEAHSWKNVEPERYADAKYRHMFDELAQLGISDEESGIYHAAHELFNALALLEQRVAGMSPDSFRELLHFNRPPTDHKRK